MSWLIVFMSSVSPVALLLVMLAADRWRRAHSKMVPIKGPATWATSLADQVSVETEASGAWS